MSKVAIILLLLSNSLFAQKDYDVTVKTDHIVTDVWSDKSRLLCKKDGERLTIATMPTGSNSIDSLSNRLKLFGFTEVFDSTQYQMDVFYLGWSMVRVDTTQQREIANIYSGSKDNLKIVVFFLPRLGAFYIRDKSNDRFLFLN